MRNLYPVYFSCMTIAMGSLSATDPSLEMLNQGEIAIHNSSSKVGTQAQTTCPNHAPKLFLQPCPDAWRLSGDFLYLLPTLDDTYFAISSPATEFDPIGTRENNDFGFNPAFRVGAEYAFCKTGRDIQIFYTYLNADESKTLNEDNLWATVGSSEFSDSYQDYIGFAQSNLSLLYQRIDFNVSQHVIETHGFNFYVQPGLEYAYLRLNQNYEFQAVGDVLGKVHQKSKSWGVGPQLGLGFDANLYSSAPSAECSVTHAVAFSGLFSSSLLTGQGKTEELDMTGAVTNVDLEDSQTWRTIPALHARAGFTYLLHGASMGASLSVGYEFSSYIRARAKTTYPSTSAVNNVITNYYNFDIQGLDISLAFTF